MAISRVSVLAEEFGNVELQEAAVPDAMARDARVGGPPAVVVASSTRGIQLPLSGVRWMASDIQASDSVSTTTDVGDTQTVGGTQEPLTSRAAAYVTGSDCCWPQLFIP